MTARDTDRLLRAIREIRGMDPDGTKNADGIIKPAAGDSARSVTLSTAVLIKAVQDVTGHTFPIGDQALDKIIAGDTKSLRDDIVNDLSEFVFGSDLGRALRHSKSDPQSPYEEIARSFAHAETKDSYIGRYLVYHGSYKTPGSLAVRAMEIFHDDNGILGVKDYIVDALTKVTDPESIRQSVGCMFFYNNNPFITLNSEDNRIGLSLFIGNEVIRRPRTRKVEEFSGKMAGLTSGNNPFYRRMSAVRRDEKLDALILESGVYSPDELIESAMAEKDSKVRFRHLEMFRGLKRLQMDDAFSDPLFEIDLDEILRRARQ